MPSMYPYIVDDLESELLSTINNIGTSGKVKITVEYFYVKGFELGEVIDNKVVPYKIYPAPNVLVTEEQEPDVGEIGLWVPTKFHNSPVVNYELYDNNTIFEVVTSDSFYTMKHDSTILRRKNLRVDSNMISNAEIYNAKDNSLMMVLQVYDPIKGIIPGVADRELAYKSDVDPAIYNTTPYSDESYVWGPDQVGKLWWDQSTIRYLDYELSDNDLRESTMYRWKNWGRIAPGTSVDVYEWVRSTVHPLEWNNYVETFDKVTVKSMSNKPSGTVKIDDNSEPKFVTRIEWNEKLQRNETVYYFWVKDVITVPPIEERKLSARQVANIITNPANSDIPFVAVIDFNKVIVSGIKQFLSDGDTILKIKWKKTSNIDVPHHKQWMLVRENDDAENIPTALWNNMRDRLVRWDDYVPKTVLKGPYKPGDTTIFVENAWDFPDIGELRIGNNTFKYNNVTRTIGRFDGVTSDATLSYPILTEISLTTTKPRQVPDLQLPMKQQIGNLNRPRQSWFKVEMDGTPSKEARKVFFENLNNIINRNPVMDQWYDIMNFLENGEKIPSSDEYVATAQTLADLDLMLASGVNQLNHGDRVLIESTV